jgi:L-fuconolactonase
MGILAVAGALILGNGWRSSESRAGRLPMPNFPIVDAHVHLYDPAAVSYPWMRGNMLLESLHGPVEFTAAAAPFTVDKIVFMEVDAASGRDEVPWVEGQAKRDRRIQAMVVSLPIERGKAIAGDIAEMARNPLVRGVRRLIQGHVKAPGWCLRPDFVDGVRLVGEHGLGFDLCIYHPQMADTIELVRRCPDVRFILDHIGKPGIRDGLREPWWSEMRELARQPNVVCKISGVLTEADHEAWTYDDVAPYITHAIECFGFDRVAFGGDWPVVDMAGNYRRWVELLDRVTAGTHYADLKKLYRDNAIGYYHL